MGNEIFSSLIGQRQPDNIELDVGGSNICRLHKMLSPCYSTAHFSRLLVSDFYMDKLLKSITYILHTMHFIDFVRYTMSHELVIFFGINTRHFNKHKIKFYQFPVLTSSRAVANLMIKPIVL